MVVYSPKLVNPGQPTIAAAEQILNSGGNTSGFNAATWDALKAIEAANNAAAASPPPPPPPPSAPAPSSPTAASPPPSYTRAPAPPPPAPLLPVFKPLDSSNRNIRVAPSDIIQFNDASVDVALLNDMLFEDIGATELANISRSDLIDGQPTIYAPIKNLASVRREYNPNNIIATAYGADYFTRFGINIFSRGYYEPYFDENGDLVVEVGTTLEGEEIQVQVLEAGIIDTIEET